MRSVGLLLGLLIEGLSEERVLSNGVLLVDLGHLGDPFLRDELEERVSQKNRSGHGDGDSKGSGRDWLGLKDRSENPGEAREELHAENNQED